MKISVLGCGRWGTFIAYYLDSLKFDVSLWGREGGKTFSMLESTRQNEFLTLPKSVNLTNDLREAMQSDVIIVSILTQELDAFLKQVYPYKKPNQKFVFCMKGVESCTGRTLSQVAIDNGFDKKNLALWVGPGHVQSFLQNISSCMIISAYDKELAKFLSNQFSSSLIRFYFNEDMVGCEIGSAAKNVVGIMSGLLDGLGWTSMKGALMARATCEVSKLTVALGGKEKTAYGLSHLGDYEATLFSTYSHNRMLGEFMISGQPYPKSAEGLGNTFGIAKLAREYSVDMPLTFCLEKILKKNANIFEIKKEIKGLFDRPAVNEFQEEKE